MPKKTFFRLSSAKIVWIGLNLTDLYLTVMAMEKGLAEANPAISWLGGNIPGLVGYKMGLTIAVIFLLARIKRLYLLKWLNIGIGAIVVWNLVWLLIVSY